MYPIQKPRQFNVSLLRQESVASSSGGKKEDDSSSSSTESEAQNPPMGEGAGEGEDEPTSSESNEETNYKRGKKKAKLANVAAPVAIGEGPKKLKSIKEINQEIKFKCDRPMYKKFKAGFDREHGKSVRKAMAKAGRHNRCTPCTWYNNSCCRKQNVLFHRINSGRIVHHVCANCYNFCGTMSQHPKTDKTCSMAKITPST